MNIILAAVNAKYIHSNLAVYCLRAYARSCYEDISIAEYTINQQTDDILQDLYQRKPDILCFSCYIWNIRYVEELTAEVKKVLPKVKIWLGGPEVSYDAKETFLRMSAADGVIRGEGEKTFLELMKYYHGDGNELGQIDGITWRAEDGSICETPWRPVMDLSEVPFVYEDMKDFENKIIYYETSRGCPFSCSYCLSSIDKCLRFRDIELVKQELKFFLDQNVPQVKFVDRTFNCRHDHAMAIWRFINEYDNGITNFHFEVAADLLNEEEISLIETMRPGLIQLEIGVQSTNPETIKEIRRVMKFEEVRRIVKRINKGENVHQHLDLIAGLPYEGLESFRSSFNDVYELEPEQLQLGFLKVLKGSFMEEQKDKYGLIYKNMPPYEVLSTSWISYGEILQLKMIEEMTEIYYNSGQFKYTLRYLVHEFAEAYEMFEKIGRFYQQKGLDQLNHSRIARYEILLQFIEENVRSERLGRYRELLTYDLYLRENVKNRPAFSGEYPVSKEYLQVFYDQEVVEHKYLKGYEQYDKRQLRKMTHIEKFHYNVAGSMEEKETYLLFDYKNRSPLTHQAATAVLNGSAAR